MQKVDVILVDSNRENILESKDIGLKSIQGSIHSTKVFDEVEFGHYSQFIAATNSDEINVLSSLEYSDIFGSQYIFRIEPSDKFTVITENYHQGRFLFSKGSTSAYLSTRLIAGGKFITEEITELTTLETIVAKYKNCLRLFIIYPDSKVYVYNQSETKEPEIGDRIVLLVS